ncbi:MAG: hypothetical protein ACQEP1_05645 [Nanobdellota archaeon]
MTKRKFTRSRNEIINSEMFRIIAQVRTDSLWSMIYENKNPGPLDEGATGKLDNYGAIFTPNGFIYNDSERREIELEENNWKVGGKHKFREKVLESMKADNAILLDQDGIASNVNLDNGFFLVCSKDILNVRKSTRKKKGTREEKNYLENGARDIAVSYFPQSVGKNHRYGSRSLLSSSLAVMLSYPLTYRDIAAAKLDIYGNRQQDLSERINKAKRPIKGREGRILAHPYVYVMHDTRYTEKNMVGLTRILTGGMLGEFSTFTIEKYSESLKEETRRKHISDEDIFAEHDNQAYLGVLRMYSSVVKPGKRNNMKKTSIIKPGKDLGLHVENIQKEAYRRYDRTKI